MKGGELLRAAQLEKAAKWIGGRDDERERAPFASERRGELEQDAQPGAVDKPRVREVDDEAARDFTERFAQSGVELVGVGEVDVVADREHDDVATPLDAGILLGGDTRQDVKCALAGSTPGGFRGAGSRFPKVSLRSRTRRPNRAHGGRADRSDQAIP